MRPFDQQAAVVLDSVGVKRGERWILRGVNWTVARGSCAAILGPNGSGKSTLARMICGYIWPSEGAVAINGQEFGNVDLNELRRSIRLVQPAGPYDVDPALSAFEVVLTGRFGTLGLFDKTSDLDRHRAANLLQRVGMRKLIDARYETLSSGERVRSLIARALMASPKLLILDEPTAGLDLLAREQVLATVSALLSHDEAPTVLLITHHVEELPVQTSNILLLSEGLVAASGEPAEVLRDEVLSHVYGCRLRVEHESGRYYVKMNPSAPQSLLD
jgi:iron complex transport system ATP-binding protein